MKTVLKPLTNSALKLLRLTETASARDTAIQKKIFRSSLQWENAEMNDIMKITKSLEDAGLLIKSVSGEAIENGKNNK